MLLYTTNQSLNMRALPWWRGLALPAGEPAYIILRTCHHLELQSGVSVLIVLHLIIALLTVTYASA
jgi:hypothetical protein